jgi:hypothetical protein
MEEKFYHTFLKSRDEYFYWQLFCIKENKIHRVSYRTFKASHLFYIPCIDLYNEDGLPLDNSISDNENIIRANNHFFQRGNLSEINVCKSDLKQGEYYPNIYRPIFSKRFIKSDPSDTDLKTYFPLYDQTESISRLNQLTIIYHDLIDIFKYVEPDNNDNMKAYGHRIRNNIFLSCTEIDSMFQNLMLKNGYKPNKKIFNTNDYIKTKTALKLDQFVIFYARYPNMPLLSPFSEWDKEKPSKSLLWYDAYNNIKHDRISNKVQANLKNAINAFSAAIILFISQYGDDESFWNKDFRDEITIKQKPHYKYNEFYLPPISSENINWTEKQYTFK